MLKMWAFFKRFPWWLHPKFGNFSTLRTLFCCTWTPSEQAGLKKKNMLAPPSFEELEAAKHYLNAWSPLGVWRQCHCVCNVYIYIHLNICIYIYVHIYIHMYYDPQIRLQYIVFCSFIYLYNCLLIYLICPWPFCFWRFDPSKKVFPDQNNCLTKGF